jgi:hypothetical protein
MSAPQTNQVNSELAACERELKDIGFSEAEIRELNSQIDGIIERGFDKYLSDAYDI